MATSVDDGDHNIDIGKIPTIDFRSFCQDEIRCVAQLSGDCLDEKFQDIVNVAINKTIFNESLGSRRQTYARDRIPRRAQHLHGRDVASKPRLLGFPEAEQIQRSSSTDLKEKRSYRENQELITRICRQMQRPLLADGDSCLSVSKDYDAATQARAEPHAKPNAVFPALKHFRTTIIAGGQLISVIEPRRDETHGQKRRHQAKAPQTEGQVMNEGSIVAAGAAMGVKRLKVNIGREESIRLKRIARGKLSEGQDAASNGNMLKENSAERSHRLSKKMKTKEEARRRASEGSNSGVFVPVSLEQVRLASCGEGDEASVRVEKPVDFKLMDAEGFPGGWKVCVALKNRRAGMTAKFIKFVSPDGQEWFSHKEALRHASSVAGINGSNQNGGALKPSKLGLTHFGDSNDHNTGASEELEPKNAATNVKPIKSHGPSHALCTTCGKTFSTLYSLRRHENRQGHGTDQAGRDAIEHKHCQKVMGAEVSTKSYLQMRQKNGITVANGDAGQETAGAAPEEMVESIKGMIAKPSKRTYKCKTCKKLLKSRKRYLTHLSIHSMKGPRKSKVREFACRACKVNFKRRRQYVDHLKTHSKRGRKKAGRPSSRKAGRPAGRPPVKVMDKSVSRIPKSKRAGQSSAASAENKISSPKSKFDAEKTQKRKSSKKTFLCDKCGAVFGHRMAYTGHQIVHSKKKNKRKYAQEHYIGKKKKRFHEEGSAAQATVHNALNFSCQICAKVFNEYFRYAGHLSSHSKQRKMAYLRPTSMDSQEKQSSFFDGAVDHDNDNVNLPRCQESLTSVLRKLLGDTNGTFLPGLCAKLLFASDVDSFDPMKEAQVSKNEKKLPGSSIQCGGVCSTCEVGCSQGCIKLIEGSRLVSDMQTPSNNEFLEGSIAAGCSVCANSGAGSAQQLVCKWCDRVLMEVA